MPPMVWGNGGCAIDSTRYSGFLTTIASYGFLVMGTAAQEGAARRQATADDLRAAIDWAEKENAREGSPLKGKIALDNVAVMGQSCGGFLSVTRQFLNDEEYGKRLEEVRIRDERDLARVQGPAR
jgi:hypothetical protein